MRVVRSRLLMRSLLYPVVAFCSIGMWDHPATAVPFDDAVETYRSYLIEDVSSALAGAQHLLERVAAKDLAGAKQSWIDGRAGWERSEVFTGAFVPDLDRAIDAWPEAPTGFHAIEAKLFGAAEIEVEAEALALVQSLTELGETARRIALSPQGLLNGMAQLAYEVGESKIDGGESRVSGTSLADMRNNVAGIGRAYQAVLAAGLEAADPALAAAVLRDIEALRTMLETDELKRIDPERLRTSSEQLVVTLQRTAPVLGLEKPTLEGGAK